jgi:hypothetical protein
MNDHVDMRKQLSAYCGGDLEPAERLRLEEHLAGCPSCRAELADLQTALRLVRTTPESEPPPWLAARIMARVREQQRERRSWWQRIFYPLRVKLPIELAALLLVCVGTYYLARDVETRMRPPAIQQELPDAPSQPGTPAQPPGQRVPAAAPATPAPPAPATKKELRTQQAIPARPAAPQATDWVAPHGRPEVPLFSRPPVAPAPPAMKEESSAPAAGSPYGVTRPHQPGHDAKSVDREREGAAEMMRGSPVTEEHDTRRYEPAPPAPAAPTAVALPRVTIRLHMIDPSSAPGSLIDAVSRCGGTVIDAGPVPPRSIRARIPSARMGELLERLERVGSIAEQPRMRDLPGMVGIEIIW